MKKELPENFLRKGEKAGFYSFVPLFLVFFLLCACAAKSQGEPSSNLTQLFSEAGIRTLNERLPSRDFSLPLASKEASQSLSGFRGKVVFLNFWATWCGPCRMEMPSMEILYGKFRDKGLEIFAVNCLEKEPEVLTFMESNGLSFPAALDLDGRVSASYGIQAIPTSFLIDREGNIVARLVGSINWDTPKVHAAFEELLRE